MKCETCGQEEGLQKSLDEAEDRITELTKALDAACDALQSLESDAGHAATQARKLL